MKPTHLAGHALGVSTSAVVLVLVAHPLLRMAALEVETVVVNLFEQQAISLDLLPLLRSLTLLAPLPWLGVVALAFGYRFATWSGAENPLLRLSARQLRALQLVSFFLFVLGSLPLAVALAAWIALEAYEWVEWLYNLNPTMELIFALVPPLFLPGSWLLSWRLSRWALGLQPEQSSPGRLGRALQPLVHSLGALCLTGTLVVSCAAAPQMGRIVTAPSSHSFETNCGGCHFRSAALNFKKTPASWSASLATMQELAGGAIPEDELAEVEAWLLAVRTRSPSNVFETRCVRCHGLSHRSWESRSREDWSMLVDRISRWSPVFYGTELEDVLTDELSRRYGEETADLGLGAEQWERSMEVARRCSPCHSMSWNADRYREEGLPAAVSLVRRMNQKMVDPIREDEVEDVARDYLELISDPERFKRLFPHDRPLPEPTGADYVDERPERGGNY